MPHHARPAPSRRRGARAHAAGGAGGQRAFRRRKETWTVSWERIWQIEPRAVSPANCIALCDEAIRETCGRSHRLPSGPLHDAAEVARAGVPTRDDVRPKPARHQPQQDRGHEGGAPRTVRRPRSTGWRTRRCGGSSAPPLDDEDGVKAVKVRPLACFFDSLAKTINRS